MMQIVNSPGVQHSLDSLGRLEFERDDALLLLANEHEHQHYGAFADQCGTCRFLLKFEAPRGPLIHQTPPVPPDPPKSREEALQNIGLAPKRRNRLLRAFDCILGD